MLAVAAEGFDLRDIVPQPWNNGAGLTREIAVGPRGASATDFDWRFSVAEVERAAPFSVFPGIDRCIVLLAGAGLHLRSAEPAAPMLGPQQGLLWRFGAAPVHVEPLPGTPEPRLLFVRLLVAGMCHDASP